MNDLEEQVNFAGQYFDADRFNEVLPIILEEHHATPLPKPPPLKEDKK